METLFKCRKCECEKTKENFKVSLTKEHGIDLLCKKCANLASKLSKEKTRRLLGMRPRKDYTSENIKFCNRCKIEKKKELFGKDKSTKTQLSVYCKECTKVINKEKRLVNIDKIKVKLCLKRQQPSPKTKKCRICEKEKGINDFSKNINHKYGFHDACKECYIDAWRIYCSQNRNKIRAINRKSYLINREKNENNPAFVVARLTRRRIFDACRAQMIKPKLKPLELIGCSWQQFAEYLESKFGDKLSWDNRGLHGWHIDHIKPCASFDLSDEQQLKQCFHYTNCQPLWYSDNISKNRMN